MPESHQMAIEILDFPVEVLQQILLELVLDYGVKRSLRLRLVCKLFSVIANYAIYQSGLLDYFYAPDVGRLWQIKRNRGAAHFWHGYMVQRVLTEQDLDVGRYVDIREVAQRICKEIAQGSDLRDTVQKLCWLALDGQTSFPGRSRPRSTETPGRYDDSPEYNSGLSLLSAASHFNLTDLVESLLSEGHCSASRGDLFPSAMQIVAMDGNASLLKRFQQQLPEFKELPLGYKRWRGKGGPWSVLGAAIRGDMDMLNLALYPPSRANHSSTDYAGQPYGEIEDSSPVGLSLREAQRSTNNPEVFDFIDSFFRHPLAGEIGDDIYRRMAWHARAGNIDMVRHLLQKGVPTDLPSTESIRIEPALTEACKGGNEDIVDLLLEHGANPNHGPIRTIHDRYTHPPLSMAASSGSLSIVRKLLDHGASVNDPDCDLGLKSPAILYAVAVEHTEMVQLLISRGSDLNAMNGLLGETLSQMAVNLGLDSMADIPKGYGFAAEPTSVSESSGAPWLRWPMVITASNVEKYGMGR